MGVSTTPVEEVAVVGAIDEVGARVGAVLIIKYVRFNKIDITRLTLIIITDADLSYIWFKYEVGIDEAIGSIISYQ